MQNSQQLALSREGILVRSWYCIFVVLCCSLLQQHKCNKYSSISIVKRYFFFHSLKIHFTFSNDVTNSVRNLIAFNYLRWWLRLFFMPIYLEIILYRFKLCFRIVMLCNAPYSIFYKWLYFHHSKPISNCCFWHSKNV